MNHSRRKLLKVLGVFGSAAMFGIGALRTAFAAQWNQAAFVATEIDAALKAIGATGAIESRDILIKTPQIAENGAVVPIEVTSKIPNTESIAILVEDNPQPLIAQFNFANGAESFVSTRIKVGESSNIKAIVKANGKHYAASKDVEVTIGGCGE